MKALNDFLAAQRDFNDKQDSMMNSLQQNVQAMSDEIARLQNSAGEVTPEDQASLDKISEHSKLLLDQLSALNDLSKPAMPHA